MRREAHALCLQCGLWIAASPEHARSWEADGLSGDAIVRNWLVRGIVLAERLLPVLVNGGELIDHTKEECDRLRLRLGFNVDTGTYPDAFNPFLFGIEKLDHGLVALLHILDTTWTMTVTPEQPNERPYWWTETIEADLTEVTTREELYEEQQLQFGQKKVNHLLLSGGQTPQEYARRLLMHANEPKAVS